ncbi:MAG: uroporphyrinogen-III synthase [Caulobacter sp.]|nr:uroporphyrinogen-III synthase [Caulobacter sp.]
MPTAPLTVWITRAEPGAAATAERVAAMGHRPVVAPLLRIEAASDVAVDLTGVAALAFTSANGVRAFAALCPRRDIRVFAVGAGTTAAAKAAGFKSVLSAEGDVGALAGRIAARRAELRGAVLHPGAAEPAGDLVGSLVAEGLEARSLALYDSVAVAPPADLLAALDTIDVVLLHSPKAARALARLLRGRTLPNLRLLCLSQAVARPVARTKVREVVRAPFPIEAALLNLIGRGAVPTGTAPRTATRRLKSQ